MGGTPRGSHRQVAHVQQGTDMPIRIPPAVLIGAVVGVVVGLTSVGSGSLVVTALLLGFTRYCGRQW